MFSPHLFAHRYDIDDILAAFCAATPSYLNTTNGTFSANPPANTPATNVFPLEPLPASFLTELSTHAELRHLSPPEQAQLHTLLATATVQTLPGLFPEGRPGGWLRERVKEAALEWLDSHNLIPPSMRHINRSKPTVTSTAKINIDFINIESDI